MSDSSRAEFAERLRVQVASRYGGVAVEVDASRFTLHVMASGVDTNLPLAPLFHACEREPSRTPVLIADFVRSVERQLTPTSGMEFKVGRVLWCVRSRRYLQDMSRRDELMCHNLGGDLVAFAAEALPAAVMRGVSASTWREAGIDDATVRAEADKNTAARFKGLTERIAATERIPGDGWRLSGDVLYQGSVLMVPAILDAFVARCDGDVLLANPDRSVLLALPAALPSARHFGMRAVREWREAMNPASREVFRASADGLTVVPRKRGAMLPWLSE